MFRDAKLLQEVYKDCMACKSPIDDEDSASFVSVGDPRMRGLSKPLIVFFLYAGDDSLSDKVCLECFDKFKGIADFYKRCKNSKSQYVPCFGESSGSDDVIISTPRILSTETPDVSASSTSDPAVSRGPSSMIISSNSRSVPTQTCSAQKETQSTLPREKKKYAIHHDLGIRLPKPLMKERGCFDADDYCYVMLQDEFEREIAKDEANGVKNLANQFRSFQNKDFQPIVDAKGEEVANSSGKNLANQFKSVPKKDFHPPVSALNPPKPSNIVHPHVANCPFCPAVIPRKPPTQF